MCECDEGWFGLRCEFHEPCKSLEVDARFDEFLDYRDWSQNYDIFELEDTPVYAYGRPVYYHEPKPGEFDVVVFTGRRWMATHTGKLCFLLPDASVIFLSPDVLSARLSYQACCKLQDWKVLMTPQSVAMFWVTISGIISMHIGVTLWRHSYPNQWIWAPNMMLPSLLKCTGT